ncbi:hypothetical protein BP00DRAFT_437854 [Aspergillus indologenus CBS 114.80]|uniref:Uncharacterized protein n=1 Tax=Aspergillus indologenus CBS 114.80 TaxID=1450541 RepID=A0A2V5IL03_9EURO|nr:hypothetical protein BP00DRAFT_437854 [Aspergillus indologenus CBS 114.80]
MPGCGESCLMAQLQHKLGESSFEYFDGSEMISSPNTTDLFRYTRGRWLWDIKQQLQDCFSLFNILELQRVAAQSIGAEICTAIIKLAKGLFNKTFRLEMGNGLAVIVRIPHPITGPEYYTTVLEVAMMEFVSTEPRGNPVGSEYIIIEKARGTKLEDVWDDFSLKEKIVVIKDLVSLEREMVQVPLNSYGSLYYAGANIRGAVPADTCTEISAELQDTIRSMALNRGPWKQSQDYVLSLAHREEAWIQCYVTLNAKDDLLVTSAIQNSSSSYTFDLLLVHNPAVVVFYIWYTNLHAGNIFVYNRLWAAPLILQAQYLRLINYSSKDYSWTRCEPILFMGDTWDDDLLPLRESLIRLERCWTEVGVDFPCPIHFTEDDLRVHAEEDAGWNDGQEFWNSVAGVVSKYRWTPHYLYGDAVALFTELRDLGLKAMAGKERDVFESQTQ